jgi:hypothetical protein
MNNPNIRKAKISAEAAKVYEETYAENLMESFTDTVTNALVKKDYQFLGLLVAFMGMLTYEEQRKVLKGVL